MRIRHALQRMPLYGELLRARRSTLIASAKELAITTLFATLPLWFFPLIFSAAILKSPSMFDLVLAATFKGELFLYSAAMIGPLVYLIWKKYRLSEEDEREGEEASKGGLTARLTFEFPYGMLFVVISIMICMVSAFFYTMANISSFPGLSLPINLNTLFSLSIVIYALSLSCLYSVSVYRAELDMINQNLPHDEREFMKQWKKRNG